MTQGSQPPLLADMLRGDGNSRRTAWSQSMSGGLDAVEIRGFRGIRQGALEGLSDVNVLVGRNNSGKTTVAEAISRAAQEIAGRVDLSYTVDVVGRDRRQYWQAVRRESSPAPREIATVHDDGSIWN